MLILQHHSHYRDYNSDRYNKWHNTASTSWTWWWRWRWSPHWSSRTAHTWSSHTDSPLFPQSYTYAPDLLHMSSLCSVSLIYQRCFQTKYSATFQVLLRLYHIYFSLHYIYYVNNVDISDSSQSMS